MEDAAAELAAETGLRITVCHLPPGTTKWNKIEHRLFSPITLNWRGRPLDTHEVIVELIAATTTKTGLRVHAALDTDAYQKGIRITDKAMKASRPPTCNETVPRRLELHRDGPPADNTTHPNRQE